MWENKKNKEKYQNKRVNNGGGEQSSRRANSKGKEDELDR